MREEIKKIDFGMGIQVTCDKVSFNWETKQDLESIQL